MMLRAPWYLRSRLARQIPEVRQLESHRLLAGVAIAAVVLLTLVQLPDLIRYAKIELM